MDTRIDRLRSIMAEQGIDLVVLGPGSHLSWLLNVEPHADERPLLCCISADNAGFLMPALEADSARVQTELAFYEWSDDQGPVQAFNDLLTAFKLQRARQVVLDESMRADFAWLVHSALPDADVQFTASTVGLLRMRKDAKEFEALKHNAVIADHAMQVAWSGMKAGMTEQDVVVLADQAFADRQAKLAFGIVGTGSNGAFPHHHTGTTPLTEGDAVVMDIGAGSLGYFSDITRMAIVGDAPSGYTEIHRIVDAAVEAALQAARPGVVAKDVDAAARSVIENAGYGEYFVHRTGHGLGTEIHEPPYITASSTTVLEEGMVFSIEPGIYLPDRFGLRLEEIVILRHDGPEVLSTLSRDARIVG